MVDCNNLTLIQIKKSLKKSHQSTGSVFVTHGLSCLYHVGSFQIRIEPVSLTLTGGFFTIESPRKPSCHSLPLYKVYCSLIALKVFVHHLLVSWIIMYIGMLFFYVSSAWESLNFLGPSFIVFIKFEKLKTEVSLCKS